MVTLGGVKNPKMTRHHSFLLVFHTICFTLFCSITVKAQGTLKEYTAASQAMGYNLSKLYYNQFVAPNWMQNGQVFTYVMQTRKGKEWFIVDPAQKNIQKSVDQNALVNQLNLLSGNNYKPYELPVSSFTFNKQLNEITFETDSISWKYNLKSTQLIKEKITQQLNENFLYSPDSSSALIWEEHTLSLKDKLTGKIIPLTQDASVTKSYGSASNWHGVYDQFEQESPKYSLEAYWSPDSKKIIVPVFDRSKTRYMQMFQWAPKEGLRPHVYAYERAMPGEEDLTTTTYVLIDAVNKTVHPLDLSQQPDFLGTYVYWSENSKKAYRVVYERGYTARRLIEIDAENRQTHTILEEHAKTSVDVALEFFYELPDSKEFIWMSEQDGWNHLFLYDLISGKQKNLITNGQYVVRSVEWVDVKHQKIYFMACGVEPTEDPYYKKLYVVNFDGSGMLCLTPENADHTVSISGDHLWFVDNYSQINQPNIAKLRSTIKPQINHQLATGDIDDLLKIGWRAPESFTVKARDGKTDIYGVIYRPFNYDSTKKYPVIDGTYSGPHTIRSPKTFRKALVNDDIPIAQLGFIVVTIDGLGSAFRSKEFRSHSWKNLGDTGAPDHIKAILELARKDPSLDTTRVGIYGHSAGGYDAARALITHPEFYKVAVASAGCHDLKIDKIWWPEHHMGLVGPHYDEQSNIVQAKDLKGKLFLVHGDMDNNVNPVASLRFAAELIKHNKNFDLLILPGHDHYTLYNDKYFIRQRWDFFVRHLMGVTPPEEFLIQ